MVRASVKPSPASLQHGRIELVAETVKEFPAARLCPCPRRYSDGAPAQPYGATLYLLAPLGRS